jgi:hypothetical protein
VDEAEAVEDGVSPADGVALPVGATVVNGVLVGDWKDFIQMIIDNLPKILDFLMTILPFIIGLF